MNLNFDTKLSFFEKNYSIINNIFFILLCIALVSHFFVTKSVALTSICFGIITGYSLIYFILNKFKINKIAIIPVISILGMLACIVINTIICNGFQGLSRPLLTNKYYMVISICFLIGFILSKKQITILLLIFGIGYFTIAFIGIFRYFSFDFGYIFCKDCLRIGVIDSNYLPFSIYHCSLVLYLTEAIVIFSMFYCYKNRKRFHNKLVIIFVFLSMIFIHVIGSRIGLIIFYSLVLYFLFLNIKNKWISLKYVYLLVLSIPVFLSIIYFGFSSVRMRLQHTIDDYKSINYEVPAFWVTNFNYRVAGIMLAFDQYPANKYKGIGYIDEVKCYKDAVFKRYNLESTINVMPHNQFIKSLIVLGLPLCILFFIFYFLPLFFMNNNYLTAFYIVNFLGFMTDTPVEIKHWLYSYCIILPLIWSFCSLNEKVNIKL